MLYLLSLLFTFSLIVSPVLGMDEGASTVSSAELPATTGDVVEPNEKNEAIKTTEEIGAPEEEAADLASAATSNPTDEPAVPAHNTAATAPMRDAANAVEKKHAIPAKQRDLAALHAQYNRNVNAFLEKHVISKLNGEKKHMPLILPPYIDEFKHEANEINAKNAKDAKDADRVFEIHGAIRKIMRFFHAQGDKDFTPEELRTYYTKNNDVAKEWTKEDANAFRKIIQMLLDHEKVLLPKMLELFIQNKFERYKVALTPKEILASAIANLSGQQKFLARYCQLWTKLANTSDFVRAIAPSTTSVQEVANILIPPLKEILGSPYPTLDAIQKTEAEVKAFVTQLSKRKEAAAQAQQQAMSAIRKTLAEETKSMGTVTQQQLKGIMERAILEADNETERKLLYKMWQPLDETSNEIADYKASLNTLHLLTVYEYEGHPPLAGYTEKIQSLTDAAARRQEDLLRAREESLNKAADEIIAEFADAHPDLSAQERLEEGLVSVTTKSSDPNYLLQKNERTMAARKYIHMLQNQMEKLATTPFIPLGNLYNQLTNSFFLTKEDQVFIDQVTTQVTKRQEEMKKLDEFNRRSNDRLSSFVGENEIDPQSYGAAVEYYIQKYLDENTTNAEDVAVMFKLLEIQAKLKQDDYQGSMDPNEIAERISGDALAIIISPEEAGEFRRRYLANFSTKFREFLTNKATGKFYSTTDINESHDEQILKVLKKQVTAPALPIAPRTATSLDDTDDSKGTPPVSHKSPSPKLADKQISRTPSPKTAVQRPTSPEKGPRSLLSNAYLSTATSLDDTDDSEDNASALHRSPSPKPANKQISRTPSPLMPQQSNRHQSPHRRSPTPQPNTADMSDQSPLIDSDIDAPALDIPAPLRTTTPRPASPEKTINTPKHISPPLAQSPKPTDDEMLPDIDTDADISSTAPQASLLGNSGQGSTPPLAGAPAAPAKPKNKSVLPLAAFGGTTAASAIGFLHLQRQDRKITAFLNSIVNASGQTLGQRIAQAEAQSNGIQEKEMRTIMNSFNLSPKQTIAVTAALEKQKSIRTKRSGMVIPLVVGLLGSLVTGHEYFKKD